MTYQEFLAGLTQLASGHNQALTEEQAEAHYKLLKHHDADD
jgi:hypothetical protein